MIEIDCIHAKPCGRADAVDCAAGVCRRPHVSVCVRCKKRMPGKIVRLEAAAPKPPVGDEQLAAVRQICFGCKACDFAGMSTCAQRKALARGYACPEGRVKA